MGCTFGLDMYIGTLWIGDWNCDNAGSITYGQCIIFEIALVSAVYRSTINVFVG